MRSSAWQPKPFLWLICEESKFLYHLIKGFLSSKYKSHPNIVISHHVTNLLGPVCRLGARHRIFCKNRDRADHNPVFHTVQGSKNKQAEQRQMNITAAMQDQDLWPDTQEKIHIHCLFGCHNILQSSIFISHLLQQNSFICSHRSF